MREKNIQKLFNQYIAECEYTRDLRPATIWGYKNCFHLFQKLVPNIETTDQLSPAVLTEFFEILSTRKRIVGKNTEKVGIKGSTKIGYWRRLNSFFKWMVIRGSIEQNHLKDIKPAAPVYEDLKVLKRHHIDKMIAAIKLNSKNSFLEKRDMAILFTLFFCGIRKGELLSLRVQDISLKGKNPTLTINGATSKSRSTRKIPINRRLISPLQDYIEERKRKKYKSEFFWVSSLNDARLTSFGLKHWVDRLKKSSGVKFHLHQFRHTFTCALDEKNVSASKIQKLLGHSDLRMTQRYLRSTRPEDLRDEINSLSIDILI
ncbi:MAG: site-specific integrase [Bacteroidetes bacterium]|nr:MAG: site-specific integrase [Bacteroidota bacterium]